MWEFVISVDPPRGSARTFFVFFVVIIQQPQLSLTTYTRYVLGSHTNKGISGMCEKMG